jgi:hypothetical protein
MCKAVHFFRIMVEDGPKTEPVEDVRKMGIEMLFKKAQQKGILVDLLDNKEMQRYIKEAEEVIAIGD